MSYWIILAIKVKLHVISIFIYYKYYKFIATSEQLSSDLTGPSSIFIFSLYYISAYHAGEFFQTFVIAG
jgi:hypothetical protein